MAIPELRHLMSLKKIKNKSKGEMEKWVTVVGGRALFLFPTNVSDSQMHMVSSSDNVFFFPLFETFYYGL